MKVIEEERKEKEDKVKISYNVGNISIDSEEYKGVISKNSDSNDNENRNDEQGRMLTEGSKQTPRKGLDFNASNAEELSSVDFNESILEFNTPKTRKRGTNYENISNSYKITNFTKKRSKFDENYILAGTTEIQILEVEDEDKEIEKVTKENDGKNEKKESC